MLGLHEQMHDAAKVQQATTDAVAALRAALARSHVGFERAAMDGLRGSPERDRLGAALATRDRCDSVATDHEKHVVEKTNRLADVEALLRDVRQQLDHHAREKRQLKDELKGLYDQVAALRVAAQGRADDVTAAAEEGRRRLDLLAAEADAATAALHAVEASHARLRTQRDALEDERAAAAAAAAAAQAQEAAAARAAAEAAARADEALARAARSDAALAAAAARHRQEVAGLHDQLRGAEARVLQVRSFTARFTVPF